MKLTIHIGSHKAGSTAIQQTCARETARLAGAGTHYPTDIFPAYPGQHSELAALLREGDDAALDALLDGIVEAAAAVGAGHVFLSGEDLCTAVPARGIDRLARACAPRFDGTAIVLVLRRKTDYLLSHFNHFLRHSPAPQGTADFRRAVSFAPKQCLDTWRAAFGAENVTAFTYDSAPGAEPFLARFFCEILGIDLPSDVLAARAGTNASFDLISAILVNELMKPLPDFDLAAVNRAWIGAFGGTAGRLPRIEADVARFLDGLFPEDEWEVPGLPGLTAPPAPRPALNADEARTTLDNLAEFVALLREPACASDRPARRSDIVAAYQSFLGRSPAVEEADRMIGTRKSLSQLRQMFAESPEFRRAHRERLNAAPIDVPPISVDVDASETEEQAIFARLKRSWTRLGSEKAHWSVLSRPDFAGPMTAELEDAFYHSGAAEFRALETILARAGRSVSDFTAMVDYGCGLGRFTSHALGRIPKVTGIDFSATHLQAARTRIPSGIDWVLKTGLGPDPVGAYDLWHSRIVLQHNPPPLMARLLRDGLAGLAPGGIAVFQIPTYSVGYSFDLDAYLAAPEGEANIEMHCLPQPALLRLLDSCNCRLLELREDNSVDIPRYWVSNTVVAEKLPAVRAVEAAA